ncbi:kinase-like domain-containing protein, partial [Piptocephalis cylindrospora]
EFTTILGFEDQVAVMPSLVQPKRLGVLGSDGQSYRFLVKPKDDLRKDARLMEFNSMINRLLGADVETRRRKMHIRTYAVLPLNDTCGLIEWVPKTVGLRLILGKYYSNRGVSLAVRPILSLFLTLPIQLIVLLFAPRIKPVFHEWFLDTFPDPERWYAARKSYSVTLAVMSMIGYLVGLGDRHGENILFDSTNGEAVHVDLNCLFDKGKTFERPELVPFRLTQNLVAALGVTGVEGAFRRTCEETLRVIREHEASLMCVLETFVHDPLVEWGSNSKSSRTSVDVAGKRKGRGSRDAVQDNRARYDRAIKVLRTVEKKLQGEILHAGLNLSEKGQVDELIRQAVDPDNLSKMYIGWAAFL